MATYRDQFESAMKCTTAEEASAWMEKEIGFYVKEYGQTEEEARTVIMVNLRYMAGYFDVSTALKVKELFGAAPLGLA